MKTRWIGIILAIFSSFAFSAESITVTTWNIEKLGSEGRGFAGGYGRANLALRTEQQLHDIADLIKNELQSDIVAVQEVSITHVTDNESRSRPLDTIVARLGPTWRYYLPPISEEELGNMESNLFVGFLWNSDTVFANKLYVMDVPNVDLGGAPLFKRKPVVGYFDALKEAKRTNDFALINVHLKSGQHYDENHLIAITTLEYRLTKSLGYHQVKESDRIVLGDFNDNPYAKTEAGNQKYSRGLYQHMAFKKYEDLVTEDIQYTRMNAGLDSIIDHILMNVSASKHVVADSTEKYLPENTPDSFAVWRQTYSDHFPISFQIKVANKDDDVDFH
jgi:endonuclease/exonuclease/phosphatase family metal-dependent hydrolase